MGFSDGTIGDLLGHARRGVTAIRRADPMLAGAADKVSEAIARMLDGNAVSLARVGSR